MPASAPGGGHACVVAMASRTAQQDVSPCARARTWRPPRLQETPCNREAQEKGNPLPAWITRLTAAVMPRRARRRPPAAVSTAAGEPALHGEALAAVLREASQAVRFTRGPAARAVSMILVMLAGAAASPAADGDPGAWQRLPSGARAS